MRLLDQLKVPFFTVLFIFLFLVVFTKIFGPIPFAINSITTTKTNLFTVTGEGEASTIPDTAHIMLGVSKTAPTVQDAQNQANSVANKIIEDIKRLGVETKDIKTTNYSVSPNYDFNNGRQTTNGYTVSENIDIKIKPVDKANKAIDIATNDGANVVGGINFVLDDEKQQELENKARDEAIKKAKEKAASIARSAGIKLGQIVDIQENNNGLPQPMPMAEKAMPVTDSGAPTQVSPGENTVHITVTISYQTL